jgi:hypothetical protein
MVDLPSRANDVGPLAAWLDFWMQAAEIPEPLKEQSVSNLTKRPRILLRRMDEELPWFDWSCDWATDPALRDPHRLPTWQPCVPAIIEGEAPIVLPSPVLAPVAWNELMTDLREVTIELGNSFRDTTQWAEDSSLFEPDRLALAGVDLTLLAASRRTPSFVAPYAIRRSASSSLDALELVAVRDGIHTFPVSQLAQGYHLWFQLALRDRIDAIRAASAGMYLCPLDDPRWQPLSILGEAIIHKTPDGLEAAIVALDDIERAWGAHQHNVYQLGEGPLVAAVQRAPRLYIVDEPERHLHPALQREAAEWARGFAAEDGVQILYATHSPAFLGAGQSTNLIHVERDSEFLIKTTPLDPRDLTVADQRLRELGLDRGEYLALFRAVLFVEGLTDQAVLEELCGDRLRDIGVLVQPFHGTKDSRKIVEAETLMRVLGPPFHVLVDNCPDALISEISGMTKEELDSAIRTRRFKNEASFLAHIRRGSLEAGRPVEIHGIPYKDILGVLDDGCIQSELTSRGVQRAWPGFDDLVAAHGERYNAQLGRYGIDKKPELFHAIARRMREAGMRAPALDGILDEIWRSVNGWGRPDHP